MLANIVEKWCLRGWYKNQKIPDLCGGAEQLQFGICGGIGMHSHAERGNEMSGVSAGFCDNLGTVGTRCLCMYNNAWLH
ncbi:hypothetical protein [Endozoicomonas sp. SCSIO W0465]|uniref:hypothetical protein n=1 Tax=Endozoicomonas sp. SCSIO W0465 TaxID=2918516 RepID=UPI002074C2A5|nr:hypothetical protein [Endozoicomonas sp. SCSIO W0465]USE35638.1 hypothetical protein MJO57_26765 [Endozoicomonas sp. SCSIO W0465]